jgi:hypothetical protein
VPITSTVDDTSAGKACSVESAPEPGTHEVGAQRDLSVEMASFINQCDEKITPDLVRKFIQQRPKNDVIESFTEDAIGLLMGKANEYDLPARRRTFANA